MKRIIILLLVIFTVIEVYGQKKSKADPKDLQIDSLTKTTKNLTLENDSLKGELIKFVGLYNTIKEKVLHYDFDPTRSAFLIDSLQATRDSAAVLISQDTKASISTDEISVALNEIKTDILSIKTQLNPENDAEKTKAINSLKQLKELFDNKIITEDEFNVMKKKYVEKL
jgi:hypothetical protein